MQNNISLSVINTTLEKGGVIIYPAETLYGIGTHYLSKKGIERVYKIKGRDSSKQFILLCKDIEMVKKVVKISEKNLSTLNFLKNSFWPGHLTAIFEANDNYFLKTVAVRVPNTPFLNKFFEQIDYPVTSTSVNITGSKPYTDINKILKDFSKVVDLIVTTPPSENGKSSTIVDFTKDQPILIRDGEIPFIKVKEVYEQYKSNYKR